MTRPDDWHLHLRDGEALKSVLPHSARQFARAIVMPNLRPPVTTVAAACAYRQRILAALPAGAEFRAADDALPDRQHAGRRDPARGRQRLRQGGQALSGRGDDQLRCRRDRSGQVRRGARRDGKGGHAAARAWRSDRSDVDIFDRENVFIDTVLRPLLARTRGCAWCSSTSRRRCGAVRRVRRVRTSRRRSPRITCSTTATRSSRVVFARTITVCRC
jgi:dihydroorotase